jgi:hypothetical protein
MADSVMGDLAIKLITIERLLILLLSEERFAPLIERVRAGFYDEFDVHLNRLFPSDPEYQAIQDIRNSLDDALNRIELNIDSMRDH